MLTFEKMARDYVELHGGKFVSTRPVGDGRRSTLVQYPTGGFVSIVSKYEPVLVTLEGGYDALWSSFMDFVTRYRQHEGTVAA